jgi:hypothetical protein
MWTPTYHRFTSRAAFLAACEAAGWPLDGAAPQPPQGVAVDELGPLLAPATLGPGGAPIPGEVLDFRHHVNLAWHAQDMPPAFAASQVLPTTPSRVWA